ncbi:PIR Superfamily Protein [Plasmodium ovale wallikeri]|uniref:PIR Superfamily Protein n=1 Tax=Plasmodium ovale wallikeri TaxID=864142 RepID=A0A1A9A5D5_PLAOA|nr:PIR Superfamily Protein [Plasmodium ovale wallikeri]SBT51322.1 PIR Superfamily Protein [Plasmodium ovale wallikeri]
MATIHVVSSGSQDTSGRDKCINILSDIQSTVTTQIAELHASKEEDEKFVQICEYLGKYLDFYDDDIKECYVGDFSYLYKIIISLLNEELTKSPKYIRCIQKVTSEIKEHIDPKNQMRDYQIGNDPQEAKIQLQKKVQKLLESSEEPLEIKELEHKIPVETGPKTKSEEDRISIQTNLEQSENSVPSPQLEVPPNLQPEITSPPDTQRAQETVTRVESTSYHSESVLTPSQKCISTEVTADRDSGQKVTLICDLDNEDPSPPEKLPTAAEGDPIGKGEASDKVELSGISDSSDVNGLHSAHSLLSGQSYREQSIQLLKPNKEKMRTGHTDTNTALIQNANAEQNNKNRDVLIDTQNSGYKTRVNSGIITNEGSDLSETTIFREDKDSSTPEAETGVNSLKMYIIIGLSILGFLLLLILLFKFTTLGSHFSKKKKKKRQEIQEELERIMHSPSNFNENNMYLSYSQLED